MSTIKTILYTYLMSDRSCLPKEERESSYVILSADSSFACE
jgi:hypothetical protein